jgi:hypothetical protein
MVRNLRPSNDSLQSLPDPDVSREPVRVPNEADVGPPRMARWREALFRILLRADARWAASYGIPAEQVHHVDVPIER